MRWGEDSSQYAELIAVFMLLEETPTPKMCINVIPLFYLAQNCYVEPHTTAFTHCMACVKKHEVLDAPALQLH